MVLRAGILWVVGLLAGVPYATYYLLFEAPRDQYALLITGILFWLFGYWSLVVPLLMAIRVRTLFRAIERAGSKQEIERILNSADARDVAIDLLATENRIPRFLARQVYDFVMRRMSEAAGSADSERAGSPPPSTASRSSA